MSAIRFDLEEAVNPSDLVVEGPPRWRERLAWGTAVAAVALLAVATASWRSRPVSPVVMRLEIVTPATPDPVSFAISPDGGAVVFVAGADGRPQLWHRRLDSTSSRPLDRTDGAQYPFWSADGRSIGFFADGRLKRIDLESGLVQVLAAAAQGRGGTWNAEGVILFAPNTGGPIYRVAADGGEAVPVTRLDPAAGTVNHRSPHFLPDGRHFVYFVAGGAEDGTVAVGSLDSASAVRVLSDADGGAVYAPSGHLLYRRSDTLLAQAFDVARLQASGERIPVAQGIAYGPNMPGVAVSAAGHVLYRSGTVAGRRQFVWVDRSGARLGEVGPSGAYLDPALSHDGRFVAIRVGERGTTGLALLDTARGRLEPFTVGIGRFPVWSPDDSTILFSGQLGGFADPETTSGRVNDLFLKPVTGAGREELLLETPRIKAAMDWSPDGRHVLYRTVEPATGNDLYAMALADRKPFAVAQTTADEREGQFSPNGEWIAFVSNESGRPEVYVQPFPRPGAKQSISSNGGGQPRWRGDGRELFYLSLDGRLMSVPLQYDPGARAIRGGMPTPLFATNIGAAVQGNNRQQYAVAPDGQRFLLNAIVEEGASPLAILLNWNGSPGRTSVADD